MSEKFRFVDFAKILLFSPFSAVTIQIPKGRMFEAQTTQRSRNLRPIKSDGNTVTIPTGAGGRVLAGDEDVLVKDWRGRSGHEAGASVTINNHEDTPVILTQEDNQLITPGGIEITYKKD